MIIEIAGTSTANKGAELMLIAIAEHFAPHGENVQLAVDPWFGSFEERARYGLRTKLALTGFGRSTLAMRLMPQTFRKAYGLVAERDVDAVLDASGFAFGDQLGPERSERFAREACRWKAAGKRLVLLPQAFGPFESPRVRRAFTDVVRVADLIYAREWCSYGYLRDLAGGNVEHLRLAPDFTNLIEGELPAAFDPQPRLACIVPNQRMMEKTGERQRVAYIPFLAACVRELQGFGLQSAILLHDANADESLVAPLQMAIGEPIPVLRERDPRCLKGLLGCAHVVIGSRFHALVGALSQAVPCLGVGWSHKYKMLFEDYGCPDCVLSPLDGADQVRSMLRRLVAEPARSQLIGRLRQSAAAQKQKTLEIWTEVDDLLETGTFSQHNVAYNASAPSAGCAPPGSQINRCFQ